MAGAEDFKVQLLILLQVVVEAVALEVLAVTELLLVP